MENTVIGIDIGSGDSVGVECEIIIFKDEIIIQNIVYFKDGQ